MLVPESWLREWVDPPADTAALAHELTMAGHEVDDVAAVGAALDGVTVADVIDVQQHPNADRLKLCRVSTGQGPPVEVVCGAPNVRRGMRSALATPGVTLPNGVRLRKAKIRGVESQGMLCSAAELGLGQDHDGIIDLPRDAPVGRNLASYLGLPDAVFDVNLTPNRGDCFSIVGLARDVAVLTGAAMREVRVAPVPPTCDDRHPVVIERAELCPSFAGRVIRDIDRAARSPLWMVERLRRSGLRAIHPVVDVTNYVMLELGQPLHAYDLDRVRGAIRPRLATSGETVMLLDEREVAVREDTIVIADDSGAIGLAGIMGGLGSAVDKATVNLFLEAAFWPQAWMAGRARSYGLHTDASLRFERGVDPDGQARAVERATSLLLEIAGGAAGPLEHQRVPEHLPERRGIALRRKRLAHLLGLDVRDRDVSDILGRLGFGVDETADGWQVIPPTYRFDVEAEVDLIEEVARIHGYDRIPETTATAAIPLASAPEGCIDLDRVADTLVARDYQEVITYSFVGADDDAAFSGSRSALALANPISSELSVMRSSLWPGLVATVAANAARQQERVRVFEVGRSYHGTTGAPREVLRVAGAICGPVLGEQWGAEARAADFFDLKGDVAAVLQLAGSSGSPAFSPVEHPALQPGQAATVRRGGEVLGVLGKLHPRLARRYDLRTDVFLFELDAARAFAAVVPVARPVSRFPAVRRDLSFVVGRDVTAEAILAAVARAAQASIREARIFDVYRGPGIEAGLKSVALGLILQETSRTLTDEDADAAVAAVVRELQTEFAADLRD